MTKYFDYEPKFSGVYLVDTLPRIKGGAYAINPDDKQSKEYIGFLYLLSEMRLCILILLKLNIFH